MTDRSPLTLSIRVDDAALAQRLTELLGSVPGLQLAADGEPADLVLSAGESDTGFAALTAREREVVGLLAEGLSNKEIASRLGIAPDTAKFHVASLCGKLAASSRTEAVTIAARADLTLL